MRDVLSVSVTPKTGNTLYRSYGSLFQDERNQALTLVIWTEISWSDYKLKWEPKEYGNVTTIELPHKNLWRPDILLFNRFSSYCNPLITREFSAIDKFDASYPVNSIVSYTGDVFIAPPGIVKVSCQLEMTWFPFDEQICYLKVRQTGDYGINFIYSTVPGRMPVVK